MTQTLTTEAMQEIYEAVVHVEATLGDPDAEFDLYCKLDDVGGVEATIRKLIDMLRAANRDAQPVAVTQFTPIADLYAVRIFDNGSAYVRDAAEALRISKRNDNAEIVEYVHIKRLQDSYTAPPAPAVTSELLEAMDEVIRISDRDHDAWNRAKEAIAICRAAMLSAEPTQGEKQ